MIWFKQNLIDEAIKEVRDMFDIARDINRIDGIVYGIWTPAILQEAYQLSAELREKYATIDLMLTVANSLPKVASSGGCGQTYIIPDEIKALRQDCLGILTDVLLKKGIISEIKDFIEKVEN